MAMRNTGIIDYVKEITIAMVSGDSIPANEKTGKDVANFMQQIYDKLVELNSQGEN